MLLFVGAWRHGKGPASGDGVDADVGCEMWDVG